VNASLEYLHHAVELESTDAEAYFTLANVYANIGEYGKALENFNLAIYHGPETDRYYARRAYFFGFTENFERAVLDYSEAIRLNSGSTEYFNNRGLLYLILKRDNEALADFDSAIQAGDSDFAVYYNRVVALINLERNNEALLGINIAILLNPRYGRAYRLRANIYQRLARTTNDLLKQNDYLQWAQEDLRTAAALE
jgi:tetratricopeptide (TPR) repeat protein